MIETWLVPLVVIAAALAGFVGGYVASRLRNPKSPNVQTMLDALTKQWQRQHVRADRFRELIMRAIAEWKQVVPTPPQVLNTLLDMQQAVAADLDENYLDEPDPAEKAMAIFRETGPW